MAAFWAIVHGGQCGESGLNIREGYGQGARTGGAAPESFQLAPLEEQGFHCLQSTGARPPTLARPGALPAAASWQELATPVFGPLASRGAKRGAAGPRRKTAGATHAAPPLKAQTV